MMPPLPSVVKSSSALTVCSIICPNRVCKSFHRAYDDFSPSAEQAFPGCSQRPIANIIRTIKATVTAATIRSKRVALRVYLRICRCDISHSTAVTISPPTFLHDRFYHSIRPLDSATEDHSSSPNPPLSKRGVRGDLAVTLPRKPHPRHCEGAERPKQSHPSSHPQGHSDCHAPFGRSQ